MYTDAIGGATSTLLASFYNLNQSNLNDTMVRISSGKRFQSPGINAADYFHASAMRNDVTGLQIVDRGLVDATGMMKVAEQGGQTVFDAVSKMQDLVNQYYNPNASNDAKMAAVAQFNSIKNSITTTIGNTQYGGKLLIADNGTTPLRQVILDPHDVSQTLDISFNAGDVVDANSLTLGTDGQAAEQNAMNTAALHAGSYLAKTTAYSVSLGALYDTDGQKEVTCSKNAEDTENIDGVAEAMQLSKQQISQQMTVSMMAQANMVQNLVLKLVGM